MAARWRERFFTFLSFLLRLCGAIPCRPLLRQRHQPPAHGRRRHPGWGSVGLPPLRRIGRRRSAGWQSGRRRRPGWTAAGGGVRAHHEWLQRRRHNGRGWSHSRHARRVWPDRYAVKVSDGKAGRARVLNGRAARIARAVHPSASGAVVASAARPYRAPPSTASVRPSGSGSQPSPSGNAGLPSVRQARALLVKPCTGHTRQRRVGRGPHGEPMARRAFRSAFRRVRVHCQNGIRWPAMWQHAMAQPAAVLAHRGAGTGHRGTRHDAATCGPAAGDASWGHAPRRREMTAWGDPSRAAG